MSTSNYPLFFVRNHGIINMNQIDMRTKMTFDEAQKFYFEHRDILNNGGARRKEFIQYRTKAREAVEFLKDFKGRVEFSVVLYCFEHDIREAPLCEWCKTPINRAKTAGFPRTCSRKCNGSLVAEEGRAVNMELYGVEYHTQREDCKQKAAETCMENWGATHHMKSDSGKENYVNRLRETLGVDNVFQLESVKEKSRATNIKNLGVPIPAQNPDIVKKMSDTFMSRTGYRHPQHCPEVREKSRQTCKEIYGHEYFFASKEGKARLKSVYESQWGEGRTTGNHHIPEETMELLNDPVYMEEQYNIFGGWQLARNLGVTDRTVYSRLQDHGIEIEKTGMSFAEKELLSFVTELMGDEEVISGDRSILDGREIDILIPSLDVGIEYNGLHWHSRARIHDRNYHLIKTNDATERGIRLVHVFEDEWVYRKDQTKRMIANVLGKSSETQIYGRKCNVVTDVPRKEIKDFYVANHIQGDCKQSVTHALMYDGEYVAMVSFCKRAEDEYELVRYATSCKVVGGFSKSLKHASDTLRGMGVKTVTSFADKRYSIGNLYLRNGWKHEYDTKPDYMYVIDNMRHRKQSFRRNNLPQRVKHFDENLSEVQNMEANGIYQIFDCGLMKFRLTL